jgi:hypothetical protein
MPTLTSRVVDLSFLAVETSFAAAITVAARTPILVNHFGRPDADTAAETHQMVLEKVEAAIESAGAATTAAMVLWVRAMFGGLRQPADFAHGIADVATAAVHPVRSRVRANAHRLVRKR